MICIASVHPLITWLGAKSVGDPRPYELSNYSQPERGVSAMTTATCMAWTYFGAVHQGSGVVAGAGGVGGGVAVSVTLTYNFVHETGRERHDLRRATPWSIPPQMQKEGRRGALWLSGKESDA